MAWWRIGWLRPWDRNSLRFERSIVHLKSSWLLMFAGPINWKLTLLQSNDKFVEQLRALAWCLLWLTCTLNITERWRYIGNVFSLYCLRGWSDSIEKKHCYKAMISFWLTGMYCWILRRGEEYFFTEDILGAWICCLNMFPGPIKINIVTKQWSVCWTVEGARLVLAVTHLHAEYYGEVKIYGKFFCGDEWIPLRSRIGTKRFVCLRLTCMLNIMERWGKILQWRYLGSIGMFFWTCLLDQLIKIRIVTK